MAAHFATQQTEERLTAETQIVTDFEALPAEYSDDTLALRVTARYGADLRYTAAWGRWSRYTGSRWETDTTLAVFDSVRGVLREAVADCDDGRIATRVTSAQTVAAVERLARSDRHHAATVEQWDANPWQLNTPGGVVDLHTGELCPARRDDYCTKQTAVAPGGDCPKWRAFLAQISNDDRELESFLQRICGYALTGTTREHAMFFLFGTGANGKSVFINTICGMLGDYAKTAPIETFVDSKNEGHPTDIAGLQGARLVTAIETEDGRRWAEAKLKLLTGGDQIAARFMRQDFFEFTPQFKLLIAGNHKPELRNVDEAMRRRFHLLPLMTTIPAAERDTQLTERLKAEWPGILRWAIEGCLAWQREGLNAPAAVADATAEYFENEDSIAQWIGERCVKGINSRETTAALFADFRAWAGRRDAFLGTQRRFSEALLAKGFQPERSKVARGFSGIALKTGPGDADDAATSYQRSARAQLRPIREEVSPASPEDSGEADLPQQAGQKQKPSNEENPVSPLREFLQQAADQRPTPADPNHAAEYKEVSL